MGGIQVANRHDIKQQQQPIDHGWAWVVLAAAAACYSVMPFQAAGVLMVEVMERYEGIYHPSTLIWVVTLVSILYGVVGPLAGILIEKFGHRFVLFLGIILLSLSYVGLAFSTKMVSMVLLFSFPLGIGSGMIYLSTLSVCNQYFDKRLALALSVVCGGATFSSLIHPQIYRVLFDNLSFTEACLMYCGFTLQFLIPATLIRPMSYYEQRLNVKRCQLTSSVSTSSADNKDMEEDNASDETKVLTEGATSSTTSVHLSVSTSMVQYFGSTHLSQLARENVRASPDNTSNNVIKEKFYWRVILLPKYIFVGTSMFLFSFGLAVTFVALPALGQEAGFPKSTVSIALAACGSLQMPSRIICGVLADRNIMSSTTQYASILFIAGSLLLACALLSGLAGLILGLVGLYSVATSFCGVVPAALRELIGSKYVTSGMSVNMVIEFSGYIASSYITGAIYDASGSWRTVIYYKSSMMLAAGFILLPCCIYRCRKQHQLSKPEIHNTENGQSDIAMEQM